MFHLQAKQVSSVRVVAHLQAQQNASCLLNWIQFPLEIYVRTNVGRNAHSNQNCQKTFRLDLSPIQFSLNHYTNKVVFGALIRNSQVSTFCLVKFELNLNFTLLVGIRSLIRSLERRFIHLQVIA